MLILVLKKNTIFDFIMGSNFNIYDLFTASLFVLNIFVAVIFSIRNFKLSLTHKLITTVLFLFLFRTFSIHLFLSKEIVLFPHFLLFSYLVTRISIPLLFLMLVFEKYQRKFKWYDSIHFLPALLFLANFWNLYSKSAPEKLEIISKIYENGYDFIWMNGSFLSNKAIIFLRLAPFVFYVIGALFLIFGRKKTVKLSTGLTGFLKILMAYILLNLIAIIGYEVFNEAGKNSVYDTNIIAFLTSFFILLSFFFIPNFIYYTSLNKETNNIPLFRKISFKNKNYDYIEQAEQYFILHKSFLNPDYTITQLEKEIKIPARSISKSIKQQRNQNFNQFLNEFRINYLLEQVPLETAIKTNFQDLAYQIGFNSVNNFYAYFKNKVGCTPKIYFENLKKNEIIPNKAI
jgi:AraC-like DNA-binding protein